MSKEQVQTKENTEEAVYREVDAAQEAPQSEEKRLKCALIIGITEDNQMFVEMEGYEQNLVHIEGLMGYARKHVDALWNEALDKKSEE